MKTIQVLIALVVCMIAFYSEFRSIKEAALFGDWIINSLPLFCLWIANIVFLIIAIGKIFKGDKRFTHFTAFIICTIGLLIVYWHIGKIKKLDESSSVFSAMTRQIGNDGGFWLDFKTNGHLKAEKHDHWVITYYWGHYSIVKDTINLDIPLNFKLNNKAIATDTSLYFMNDSVKFIIYKH